MPEENQNIGVWQTQEPEMSSLRAETNAFNDFKKNLRDKVNMQTNLRRAKEWQTLYENSLTASEPQLCSQYDRACKTNEMARWVRKFWESIGYDWSNVDDIQLLNDYSAEVPEAWRIMLDYITNETEDDPMPYYIKLGFEKPTEEDEAKSWIERSLSNFRWSFDKAWQWLRTIWNDSNFEWKYGAIQDYAYDVYWRKHPFSGITEEEWKNVERDLRIDPSLLDKYKDPETWIKDIIMWGTVSAINATPWGLLANLWVSWVAATEPWETVFGGIWQGAWWIGRQWNRLPWFKQYRDSLATEEDKAEWDQYVWQMLIAMITRKWIKTYKELKSSVDSWGGGWTRFDDFTKKKQLKLREQWEKLWGDIWQWGIEERWKVFKTLWDTDIEGVKTYEQLTEQVKKTWEKYLEQKKELLKKNTNKYWEKDLRLPKEVDTVDWTKPVEEVPVMKWLEAMLDKAIKEKSQAKIAKINAYLDKIERWELTHADLEQLAADFWQEFKAWTFTEDGSIKNVPSAKVAADIRDDIKAVSRKLADESGIEGLSSKALEELDADYEWYKTTKWLIENMAEKVNSTRQKLIKRNLLQKITWTVGTILRTTWVDKLLRQIFGTAEKSEYSANPVELEKMLPKWLDKIDRISKKLDANASDAEILQELELSPEGRVWITSVNGYERVPSDTIFDKAQRAWDKWNVKVANDLYKKAVDEWAKYLKEQFWDEITVEKWVWRYGGSNEPTLYTVLKDVTPENIQKLADISENVFKQKSFFVAQEILNKGKSVKLWAVEWKPWTSNEVWITIKLKKPLENMKDFDKIMKQAGFNPEYEWATILPDWMWLEIYNLSAFNWDYMWMIRKMTNLLNNKLLQKYGIVSWKRWYYQIQHYGLEWEAAALYDTIK